jgi:hypothetical protein
MCHVARSESAVVQVVAEDRDVNSTREWIRAAQKKKIRRTSWGQTEAALNMKRSDVQRHIAEPCFRSTGGLMSRHSTELRRQLGIGVQAVLSFGPDELASWSVQTFGKRKRKSFAGSVATSTFVRGNSNPGARRQPRATSALHPALAFSLLVSIAFQVAHCASACLMCSFGARKDPQLGASSLSPGAQRKADVGGRECWLGAGGCMWSSDGNSKHDGDITSGSKSFCRIYSSRPHFCSRALSSHAHLAPCCLRWRQGDSLSMKRSPGPRVVPVQDFVVGQGALTRACKRNHLTFGETLRNRCV